MKDMGADKIREEREGNEENWVECHEGEPRGGVGVACNIKGIEAVA